MASFKFKFQTVKNVKEIFEEQTKREIASIETEIEKLNIDKKILEKEIKNNLKVSSKNVKVNELQELDRYRVYLVNKIKSIDKKIDLFKIDKEKKMKELITRTKERKTFDLLEEKHLEKFIYSQNKIELNQLDEVAIQKFSRVKD